MPIFRPYSVSRAYCRVYLVVFQLNVPSRALPYLGLALLVPQDEDQNIEKFGTSRLGFFRALSGSIRSGKSLKALKRPQTRMSNLPMNVVPKPLPGVSTNGAYGLSDRTTQVYGIPEPSSSCKHHIPENSDRYHYQKVDFATWTFLPAEKVGVTVCKNAEKLMNACLGNMSALYRRQSSTVVSGTRAAASVWKYDINTGELIMYWIMDDDGKLNSQPGPRRFEITDTR